MKVHSLFSSSDGNACRVFNDSASILIDCGVSVKSLFQSGRFPIDAIFVTHTHSDHIKGVGAVARTIGADVYLHRGALEDIYKSNGGLLKNCSVKHIEESVPIKIKDLEVTAFPTSHDKPNSLFFIVKDLNTNKKYGMVTDTGCCTDYMNSELNKCDALLIEANYDEDYIDEYDGYPQWQKNRIKSNKGHLSTQQTISFIDKHINLNKVTWLACGHISPRTNRPEWVIRKLKKEFPKYREFHIAPFKIPRIV